MYVNPTSHPTFRPIFTRTNIKRPSCTIAPRAKLLIRIFDYIHSSLPLPEFPRSIEITDLRVKEGRGKKRKNKLSKSMREISERERTSSKNREKLKITFEFFRDLRDSNIYVSLQRNCSIRFDSRIDERLARNEIKRRHTSPILEETNHFRSERISSSSRSCFDHLTNLE